VRLEGFHLIEIPNDFIRNRTRDHQPTTLPRAPVVFSSTDEAVPLPEPLPLADTVVTLPVAHLRARVLPNNLYWVRILVI
jgi:hypothetical protein